MRPLTLTLTLILTLNLTIQLLRQDRHGLPLNDPAARVYSFRNSGLDAAPPEPLTLTGHASTVWAAVVLQGGGKGVTGAAGGEWRFWDLERGLAMRRIETEGEDSDPNQWGQSQ